MSQQLIPSSTPEVDAEIEVDVKNLVTEDDAPVDNMFSEKQQRLLTEPLYSSWSRSETGEPRKFLAAANVGLFFSVHLPPLVPDAFLSLDVEAPHDWWNKHRSYFFWEFGKAPEVAIEVVSNRKGGELDNKLIDYARIGVTYYVVYDPNKELTAEPLHLFELHAGAYQPRVDINLPAVKLGLKLWNGTYEDVSETWLRWCDEEGNLILTGAERAKRESEHAQRESERAQRESERADRLAAKLRELGIEVD